MIDARSCRESFGTCSGWFAIWDPSPGSWRAPADQRPRPPDRKPADRAAITAASISSTNTLRSIPLTARPITGGPAVDTSLFSEVPPEASGIRFQMQFPDPRRNIREFLLMNPWGGLCVGDCDGDGLPDLYLPSPAGGCRLYRNLGGFKFQDVTVSAGLGGDFWATGAAFIDIDGDGDGDLDLYVCGYRCPRRIYINDGHGRFQDRAHECGLDYSGGSLMMAFADMDNDGRLDGYLVTAGVAPPPGGRPAWHLVKAHNSLTEGFTSARSRNGGE